MTKRIDMINSSEIRKVFAKASQFKNPINLSIGQPNFNVPEKIKNKMIEAIQKNKTSYTQSAGISELKTEILKKYQSEFAEDIIITSGVSGGIFLSLSALIEENDELIIFDPYFVIYPDIAKFLNIKPILVKTNKNFSININSLKNAITPRTKAILINSPNNPTGYIYSKEELNAIIEIAHQNDLWIISDEVYHKFDYDNKFLSTGLLYKKTIVLNGFSKDFSLTGSRLGYAVGPKTIINDMIKLQQYTFVCAPSITQYGMIDNINLDITNHIQHFKRRRDFVYNKLKDYFEINKPSGGFYFFLKLPNNISSKDFCNKCLEKELLVVPGFAFSQNDNHIRISYAVDENILKRGIDVLIEIVKKY